MPIVKATPIYYRISSFPAYGRLSRLDRRELKVGARIDADEYEKEQPNDFVLWKGPKDEAETKWEAPVWQRPSGVAPGMFRDGNEASRRDARHSLRRSGQHLSSSRK